MPKPLVLVSFGVLLVVSIIGLAVWLSGMYAKSADTAQYDPLDISENRLLLEVIKIDLPHLKASDIISPATRVVQLNPTDANSPQTDLIVRFGNPTDCAPTGTCLFVILQGTTNRYKVVGEFHGKALELADTTTNHFQDLTLVHKDGVLEPLVWTEGYYVEAAISDELMWYKYGGRN